MKSKYTYNAIILLFVFAILACKPATQDKMTNEDQNEAAKIVNQRISLEETATLLKSMKDINIIDVRTPEEYADGHLDNAVNIDFRNPSFEQNISALDRNDNYLIYCKSGGRSGQALKIMKDMDFVYVMEMEDGYSGYIKNK